MKLKTILENMEALQELRKMTLPVKVAYRLSRINSKIDSIVIPYEETKNDLIKKLGTINEETGSPEIKDEKTKREFYKQVLELQNEEVTLDIEKIYIEDLGDINISAHLIVEFIFN